MEVQQMTLNDYIAVLRRRKGSFFIPATVIFLTAAIVAVVLPSIYMSTAKILIEEQEVPADIVTSSVTSFAEQRLQTINQRIMSSEKLLGIVSELNLYPGLREKWTKEEIVQKMRKAIKLEQINAEVVDRRTGRSAIATIAFTLSYESEQPKAAQMVTNKLTTLFLRENLKVREMQALGTSEFIEGEMKKISVTLSEYEAKITQFKEKHANELPSLLQVNLGSLNRIEITLESLKEQLRTLKERERYIQTQLASIPPKNEGQDKKRLDELKAQLIYLQNRFSDEYPDVVRTKADIAELEKKLSRLGDKSRAGLPNSLPPDSYHNRNERKKSVEFSAHVASFKLENNAKILIDKLKALGYPAFSYLKDVESKGKFYRVMVGRYATELEAMEIGKKLREHGYDNSIAREIYFVQEKPQSNPSQITIIPKDAKETSPDVLASDSSPDIDNPDYINLKSQLAANQSEIKSIKVQMKELENKADEYHRRIETTPKVEEEYRRLTLERDTAQAKYNDLSKKLMESKVAYGLEKEQKGERFTLLEPAVLPEIPYKPNRLAIMMVGLVLGIGAGVGTATLKELSDHGIHGTDDLSMATSFPVLVSIPEIMNDKDILHRKIKRFAVAAGILLLLAVGLVIFHYFVMDLNVFWAKLSRKIEG